MASISVTGKVPLTCELGPTTILPLSSSSALDHSGAFFIPSYC